MVVKNSKAMKNFIQFINEKLRINKDKYKDSNFNFEVFDTSYQGKIDLKQSINVTLEYHKIYNSNYEVVAWTETWQEGIKDSIVTLIVTEDVYNYLEQYVQDYEDGKTLTMNKGFAILPNDNKIFKDLKGILSNVDDSIMIATFEMWQESRNTLFIQQTQAKYGAFTIIHEKIETTLGK